jgi:hypothetical protein
MNFIEEHNNFYLNEIRLKTIECAQLNFRHEFGRISSKLAEIRPMVSFYAPIWVKFGQFGKISTNLDDIRPKSVAKIQLRGSTDFKQITVNKSIGTFVH